MINKIALEYRKLRAIENGAVDLHRPIAKFEFKQMERERKDIQRSRLKFAMTSNNLQHHFKDPTGHL